MSINSSGDDLFYSVFMYIVMNHNNVIIIIMIGGSVTVDEFEYDPTRKFDTETNKSAGGIG